MPKKPLIYLLLGGLFLVIISLFLVMRYKSALSSVTPVKPTPPPPPVNTLELNKRPFVSLEPLPGRNELAINFGTLPEPATQVEVTLEYDRNKGIWDAVLKNFLLTKIPYTDELFLGSKSAGGHITYHEDVVGGKLTLRFTGGAAPYTLENAWRYDDQAKEYTEISTQDAKFQVKFVKPFKTSKIVVMQSPGLPMGIEGVVVAGPYLIRGVGPLPEIGVDLQIHLTDTTAPPKLYGWDGTSWQLIPSNLTGSTLTAQSSFYQAWVVVK